MSTERAVTHSPYDDTFYKQLLSGMSSSAESVLRIVFEFYKPESVVDVGCGRGAWLAVCGILGARILDGFDGTWIKPSDMLDPRIKFQAIDLESTLPSPVRRYDLAISVEVAEHVSEAHADQFVDGLCGASDVVLFGAAIRNQGGMHHVNEQWQSYWRKKFAERNYECYDVIRPSVWNLESVEWWYKQNTFLYVRKGSIAIEKETLEAAVRPVTDLVHPAFYGWLQHQRQSPRLRDIGGLILAYIRTKSRRLRRRPSPDVSVT
jgi:hypothetical protein